MSIQNSKKQKSEAAIVCKKKQSPARETWQRLLKNKSSVISLVFLIIVVLLAIFADVLFDKSLITTQRVDIRIQPPSLEHWFGTDVYGRDIFTRMVYGSRVSLMIGIVTMALGMLIGGLLGACAAYFGGMLDSFIMRFTDMFMAIPETLLALCVVAAMGASASSLIFALTIAIIPGNCRLVRSAVLGVVDTEYVRLLVLAV